MSRTVLTYGTFDLFHVGHLNVLRRLRALGDRLIVGVSTDRFNGIKGKRPVVPFEQRIELVRAIRYVDDAFPEEEWDQKERDIRDNDVKIFGMGEDWRGKFDHLGALGVEVVYLPRTDGISTTEMKRILSAFDQAHVAELKLTLDRIGRIVSELT